ncbi:MAG TPA: hypothetical protein DHW71_05810, partial [Gammaproteobacteria bacterium]|nr:hypothetical protein [Gammaproteobacteria bacterium]
MKVQFYKKMFNGEMRDFARIPVTDTKDMLETPVRASDVQRFPKEWAEFKQNENKKITGTLMEKLPGISEDKRIELELKGIQTIEQLDKAQTAILQGMGDVYVSLQEIAKLHVKANAKSSTQSSTN